MQLGDLFASPEELRVCAPQWSVPVVELASSTPAELLASGEPFWQAMAVARAEREEVGVFRDVFRETLELLESLAATDRSEWEPLLWIVLGSGLLRRARRERAGLIEAVCCSRLDAMRQQEILTMIENAEQTWEEELLSIGEARGEARGRAAGALEAYREMLRTQLRQRFGELPAEVLARIEQADLPALRAAFDRLGTLASLADLQL
jgi:hypothetical protein